MSHIATKEKTVPVLNKSAIIYPCSAAIKIIDKELNMDEKRAKVKVQHI